MVTKTEENDVKERILTRGINLPKQVRKEYGLKEEDMVITKLSEMVHKTEIVDNLEDVGFEVILDDKIDLHLRRNGENYLYTKGEKIYYIEDIERIIKSKLEENSRKLPGHLF